MNCKQGDLAVIVRAVNPANTGRIVHCLSLYQGELRQFDGSIKVASAWYYEPTLRWVNGEEVLLVADEQLRPIRDPGDDATDETLEWLPVPHKVEA